MALVLGLLVVLVAAAPARAGFGIGEFSVSAPNVNGAIDERAASRPFSLNIHLAMNTDEDAEPEGILREIRTDLPPGLLGNPLATSRCSLSDFQSSPPQCSGATQIGVLRGIVTDLGQITIPIYNLKPLPGSAATFGISVNGEAHMQRLSLVGAGAGSAVRFEMALPSSPAIVDVEEEIWGVPADPAHDPRRVCQAPGGATIEGCSSDAEARPLLTLPASCDEPMRTTIAATSLGPPRITVVETALSRDAGGNPRPLVGCEAVPFGPGLTVETGTGASAPTSLAIGLELSQFEGSELAGASLGSVRVDLPGGLTLNPSAGSWLTGSSWLGSVALRTPMIDHVLSGSIYLDAPAQAAFTSRLAIQLVVADEATGIKLRIPGMVEADPQDGRLSATFADLPQIPFEALELEFAGGPRSPLAAPEGCGDYRAEATLTPSTAPQGPPVTRDASFTVSTGPGSRLCPPPAAQRSAVPSFNAGTELAAGGAESPLVIQLSRADTNQHFGSFELTLPPGLGADLGSVSVGAAVGSVVAEAGLGPHPLALDGTVYLGGPYRSAPYSLEIVVPVRVGPFDLGTIVQRAAISVDPVTAQVGVRTDPLPQILAGVPLQLRGIALALDRPGFIRNPTSCEPAAITGSATTALGQTAPLSARFQVANCAGLQFEPKLSLELSGALGRNGHPALRAVLRTDPRGASLSHASFTLPAGELLDLRHLRRLCPRGVAADRCPAASQLGSIRLDSPMLSAPLRGPIYLRVPSRRLPDLTAEVRSGGLRFLLRGRATGRDGRLGIALDSLPDIPLSRALFTLPGGRHAIVVNSRSLCATGAAAASFSAHNGKQRQLRVPVRLDGRC
jgi:hypothetical protein